MVMLSALVGVAAAILLLPTVSDVLSLVRIGVRRRRVQTPAPAVERPRLAFLVPAHNERLLIQSCVRSLVGQRYPSSHLRVVVIADNCEDETAALARAAGARCLERHDPALPGKPRAIAWALERIDLGEFDAVVIVDADTIAAVDFSAALAWRAPLEAKAVQGYFGVRNPGQTALTALAAVWNTAVHRFAYALKQRAGLNVPLVGNGLCIGTQVLREQGWHAFSICEDWEMYARLTEAGVPIEGAPDAVIYAQEAHTLRQSWTQRQRWTAGKLTVLGRIGPRILRSARAGAYQKLDGLAELTSVGPVLHFALVVCLTAVGLAAGVPRAIALLPALSLVRPAVYSLAALAVQRRPLKAVLAVAFLPVYLVWRIVAAVAAFTMLGDKPWIRTQRDTI